VIDHTHVLSATGILDLYQALQSTRGKNVPCIIQNNKISIENKQKLKHYI